MKKIMFFLVVFFCASNIGAQTNPLDVSQFKGHPIQGTVSEFGNLLVQDGFMPIDLGSDYKSYSGRFAGIDDCVVILIPIENSKTIAAVTVEIGIIQDEYGSYMGYPNWNAILSRYRQLADYLTQKYGDPFKKTESFSKYVGDSPDLKMLALKSDQCDYMMMWGNPEKNNMSVILEMTSGNNEAFITLFYTNNNAAKKSNAQILDDL